MFDSSNVVNTQLVPAGVCIDMGDKFTNYILLRTATAPTNSTKWPVRIRIEVGMFDCEFGECIGEVLSSTENSRWIYLRQTGQCGSGPALPLSDKPLFSRTTPLGVSTYLSAVYY